nr:MAG TPA_asm: hypothetical protein [Bacteriophage sp.]
MSSFSTSSFVDSVCSLIVSFVLDGTPPWILIEPRRCFIERKVNTPLCGTVPTISSSMITPPYTVANYLIFIYF